MRRTRQQLDPPLAGINPEPSRRSTAPRYKTFPLRRRSVAKLKKTLAGAPLLNLLISPSLSTQKPSPELMAHNGEAGGSGGGAGYKSCLTIPEAAFFAEHGIPVPPGVRIPSSAGWALSTMGYIVPPFPQTVERLQALAQSRRRTLTPEQRTDLSYAVDGPLWPEIFKIERDAGLDDALPDRTIGRNWDAWRRWWGNRTIPSVLRDYG